MKMNTILYISKAFDLIKNRDNIQNNASSIEKTLLEVRENIINYGDDALKEYTKKFDGVPLNSLFVTQEEIQNVEIDEKLQEAITLAYGNIYLFHKAQYDALQSSLKTETTNGVMCWRKFTPIEKVGLYVPSGTAPLFSTVLMTALPAQIAGCKEIILSTPPQKDGKIHPAILFTAKICGVTKILKSGGAQAIFAMAYGTQSVPKVYKIFGPGNQFVDGAKRMVQNSVAIDMPAGPSEVMIVCDNTSNPKVIASDVLSQLEHDKNASSIIICNDIIHIEKINKEIYERIQKAPRKTILDSSITNYYAIFAENIEDSVDFINEYAPEHLIINMQNYKTFVEKINNAGSIFLGKYSAESIGDYASGTNHTLPTSGFARSFSGLSVESFGKFISFQEVSQEGFENIAKAVHIMAEAEGLYEHANAILTRKE